MSSVVRAEAERRQHLHARLQHHALARTARERHGRGTRLSAPCPAGSFLTEARMRRSHILGLALLAAALVTGCTESILPVPEPTADLALAKSGAAVHYVPLKGDIVWTEITLLPEACPEPSLRIGLSGSGGGCKRPASSAEGAEGKDSVAQSQPAPTAHPYPISRRGRSGPVARWGIMPLRHGSTPVGLHSRCRLIADLAPQHPITRKESPA